MQKSHYYKYPLRSILFLILFLVSCSQSGSEFSGGGGSESMTSVGITLKMPQKKAGPSTEKTKVQKNAAVSTEVSSIRVSVTNVNGTELVAPQTEAVSPGQKTVTMIIEVPVGLVIINVEVFDSSGKVLYFGSATTDLIPGQPANLTIEVVEPITIDPENATILAGASQSFTATLSGLDNPALIWSVDDIVGGDVSSVGSISPSDASSASYTAPAFPPESGQVIVKVTSDSNPAIYAEAIVNILPLSHTGEFPIATTSGEEQSVDAAFDGANLLVGIMGDATAPSEGPFNINAQRVSLSGALLDAPISTGRTGDAPFLAFDGTNFLMISKIENQGFRLLGQFISPNGKFVDEPFTIASALGVKDKIGGVAFGGEGYLVVYYREVNGTTKDSKVFGRMVSPSDAVGPEFAISDGFGDFGLHNVAFDGTNFLVVWTDDANDFEVKGRFVDPAGTLGEEIIVNASTAPSDNPLGLGFDRTHYMVVWSDEVGGSGSGEWDIFRQFIDPTGNLVGTDVSIATAPGFQGFPNIAFDGVNYLVSWTDVPQVGGPVTINGIFLDQSGNSIESEFTLFLEDAAGKIPYYSRIVFAGSKYFAVINRASLGLNLSLDFDQFTNRDIHGAFITPPSTLLNITKVGEGGGTVTSSPGTITCGTGGSVCSEPFLSETVLALTATPTAGSVFAGWSGDADCTDGSVTMNASKTCTARFDTDFTLSITKTGLGTGTVTSSPGTINCGAVCSDIFTSETVVTLTATPAAGSVFAGWGGDCSSTGAVTMNASKTCTARFDTDFTLSITKTGLGTGTVTTSPGGINCGATCAATFTSETVVTLTPAPDQGSAFAGWSGDADCTDGSVTMNASKTCTAKFDTDFTLTVNKTGLGTGTVTSSPVGINCGATCSAPFTSESVVTLTASPAAGSVFAGWSGDADCSDGSVTMNGNKTCTAKFDTDFSLTVTQGGLGTGTVTSSPGGINCGATCAATFTSETVVTLTPTPDQGSVFAGWTGDADCTDGSVTMDSSKTCTAKFDTNFSLTIEKTGLGIGTVTSNPDGIDCGATCSNTFTSETVVILTASPDADAGSVFAGWSGPNGTECATGSVLMDSNKNCTAKFDNIGITVNPTSGLTTTEAGGTANFTVVLQSQPTANVSIGLSSSDTTEGTVSVSVLTFTTANWNVAQTVTVTGVDDVIADGNISYTIVVAPASSNDPNYNGIDPGDVSVTNLNNDTALDHRGKEFILAFMPNEHADTTGPGTPRLNISSDVAADITVEYPVGTVVSNFPLSAGASRLVTLPTRATSGWNGTIPVRNAVRVSASDEISVIMENNNFATNDVALGLPVETLGNEYIVMSKAPGQASGSQFVVVASQNTTTVVVNRFEFQVVLNRGEGILFNSSDLTGTIVSSDKPVSVINGNKCASMPTRINYCEHLFEMAVSTNRWGTEYLAKNHPRATTTTARKTYYRILASQNSTTINMNGNLLGTINRGGVLEVPVTRLDQPVHFTANLPIFVVQYMNSLCDEFPNSVACESSLNFPLTSEYGNASMANLVPVNQMPFRYTFNNPGGRLWVNIVASSADVKSGRVLLNGTPISPSNFTPFPTAQNWLYASIFLGTSTTTTYTSDSEEGHLMTLSAQNAFSAMTAPLGVQFGAGTDASAARNALQFDGIDDFVSIADTGDFDFVSTFTIETWVKPLSVAGSGNFKGIVRGAFVEPPTSGGGSWVMALPPSDASSWTLSVCTPGL